MTQSPVIQLDAISKRFDTVTAVDGVSLDLQEGEFFALLGPSGCGKTTLLRIIAGLEAPDRGRILLDGADMTTMGASRRPINLMFQSYALFPHMTVWSNIAYGLEMERRAKAEIERRVDEIIALVQLQEFARRKPHQLSGGQRQRVALARALVKRPRVLLLDEPLGALDKKLRGQMQLELKRLQHELGLTFVVVTHDQEEALVMADRIALMKGGRIVQLDSPNVLYEQPNSRFAADFIGVTNLFDGKAKPGGIDLGGLGCHHARMDLPPDRPCTLSVRPERFRLTREAKLNGHNAFRGTISDIAYHGQDMNILIAIDGRGTPVTVRISADDDSAGNIAVGQSVWCNWRAENGRIITD